MGYDIHITRADWWVESEATPITFEEWTRYVASDPDLELTGFAEATSPRGETIRVEARGLAVWASPDGPCWFDHRRGRIVVKNPSDTILVKMREIATRLGARVQGDDGEYYDR